MRISKVQISNFNPYFYFLCTIIVFFLFLCSIFCCEYFYSFNLEKFLHGVDFASSIKVCNYLPTYFILAHIHPLKILFYFHKFVILKLFFSIGYVPKLGTKASREHCVSGYMEWRMKCRMNAKE